jgi:predicted ribosomally synthesized peptide with nif11-like leader
MSVDNVKAFFEKVEEDRALQEQLKTLRQNTPAEKDQAVRTLITIAAGAGFEFTAEDFQNAWSEGSNLTQDAGSADVQRSDCWWARGTYSQCNEGLLYGAGPRPCDGITHPAM